jgi:hypothetical protein
MSPIRLLFARWLGKFCWPVTKIFLSRQGANSTSLLTLQSYDIFPAVSNFFPPIGAIFNINSRDFQQGYDK